MLTEDQILELATTLGSATKELIREAVEPLRARVAALEQSPLEYLGVHESGKQYRRGAFVTHNGNDA